ncbi:MAG: hypothetical protein IPJ65_30420 [Archangiaceae bacterium]|nr:hypothetical protein [Archangiaceae bacterium]
MKTTALAVAALLCSPAFAAEKAKGAGPKKDDKKTAEVRCGGINECKGKGACGSATTSCAGTNECKGKGWNLMSAKECAEKKGTVVQ